MSVWISDEKLLIFASLISPSKMILFEKKYQTFDTVFHHQMKHLEVRQKYSAARRIFNSLLGVSSGDETLRLMFDILLKNRRRLRRLRPLRKLSYCSQVLCIDEATASVDLETDKLIQQTIKSEFKESTVLTIAHRLDTLILATNVVILIIETANLSLTRS